MAYPPPVPPANRTDATVMATNQAADHNTVSAALTDIINKIATMEASLYPIGSIVEWGGDLPPGNHVLCQGQAVSRTANPEVFSLIGTKFGAGDGSTTFNMPDFKGRSPVGYNPGGAYYTVGVGEKAGSPDSALPSHRHLGADHLHNVNLSSTYSDLTHYHVAAAGNNGYLQNGPGGDQGRTGPMGGSGATFGIQSVTSNDVLGGQYGQLNHRHAVGGLSDAADRSLFTDFQGVTATNTNFPPGLSVNFIMRMH